MAGSSDEEKKPLLGSEDIVKVVGEGQRESSAAILKELLKLSVPYSINALAINSSSFLNVFVLSRLDADTLAASNLTTAAIVILIASSKAALSSTAVVVARTSDKERGLGVILQQSWLQALILSLPTIILFLASEKIFILLRQDPNISKIAGEYLMNYTMAVPAIMLLKSSELFAVATKNQNVVLLVNILNTALIFGLSYIFALGKLGLPEFGIRGAAYATAISNWFMLGCILLYIRFSGYFNNYNVFSIRNRLGMSRLEVTKTLFSVGVPVGFQVTVEFVYNFLKSIAAGVFGTSSLTAEQIVNQYSALVVSPALAIATVNGIMVGRDIANCDGLNVKRSGYMAILLSLIIPAVFLILFIALPQQLTALFVDSSNPNNDSIFELTKYLFIINGINNVIDSLNNSSVGGLRGFYDTTVPTIMMLSILWVVGVPLSYLLAFNAGLGISGFFIGRGVNLVISSLLMLNRWRYSCDNPQQSVIDARVSLKDKAVTLFSSFSRVCSHQNENEHNDDYGVQHGIQ